MGLSMRVRFSMLFIRRRLEYPAQGALRAQNLQRDWTGDQKTAQKRQSMDGRLNGCAS